MIGNEFQLRDHTSGFQLSVWYFEGELNVLQNQGIPLLATYKIKLLLEYITIHPIPSIHPLASQHLTIKTTSHNLDDLR